MFTYLPHPPTHPPTQAPLATAMLMCVVPFLEPVFTSFYNLPLDGYVSGMGGGGGREGGVQR